MSMTNSNRLCSLVTLGVAILIPLVLFPAPVRAQEKNRSAGKGTIPTHPPLLTRTVVRHETSRLGYGGTVTILGAPEGAIIIEGWPRSEVDLTAEIELRADTEEDLSRLAMVNNFAFVGDPNHVRVFTTGTHDKVFMKRVAKNFPKQLLGLPWKINYRLRVPAATDIEINAGKGPIILAGVEGALTLTATDSDAQLTLTGGIVNATVATGKLFVKIPVRSWRGNGVVIRLAAGDLTVELPSGFNGDIDADILRFGKIETGYVGLESRQPPGLTPEIVRARAGAGGASFKLIVGDGTIHINKQVIADQ
ncbi:MAG: hypothetical protein ABJB97_02035 [Acidobacteriota bacterium]